MKISKRDWVQLSAYLDGELRQRELKKLETRIEGNPEFQAALEDLRAVKSVLSQAPQMPVPKNFTLRKSQVTSPQRRSPVWGYRLAAAALSFLFLGVVVIDIGSEALKSVNLGAQAPRAEEVMLESAPDVMEEPAILAAEDAVEEGSAPEDVMEKAAEAAEEYDTAGEGESEGMEVVQPTAADNEADRASESGEDPQEVPSLLTQDEGSAVEAEQVDSDQDRGLSAQALQIPWLRILEIILGLGAVGFGITAWMKRRKNQNY